MTRQHIIDRLESATGRRDWGDLAWVMAAAALVGGSASLILSL